MFHTLSLLWVPIKDNFPFDVKPQADFLSGKEMCLQVGRPLSMAGGQSGPWSGCIYKWLLTLQNMLQRNTCRCHSRPHWDKQGHSGDSFDPLSQSVFQ